MGARDDDGWGTERRRKPSNPRTLAEVPDTLRKRAQKRLGDVYQHEHGLYTVFGNGKLGDEFESYSVDVRAGERTCSCHNTKHGGFRAARCCSHIVACWLHEEEHGTSGLAFNNGSTKPAPIPDDVEKVYDEDGELTGDVYTHVQGAEVRNQDDEIMDAVNEGMRDIMYLDPFATTADPRAVILAATSTPEPFTPQQWAEWRPPVYDTETPAWWDDIDKPAWLSALRPWQTRAIEEVMSALDKGFDAVFLEAPTGAGKAQPLSEPVLTAQGFRPMGDIKIGDYVPDEKGDVHRVTDIFPQGEIPVFKVSFNDGTYTRCCADHLWKVRRYDCSKWKVVATKDLVLSKSRNIYHVPVANPVEFGAKQLSINPYLLGLLLGNGGLKYAATKFSTGDEFLAEQVRSLLPHGVFLDHYKGPDYSITTRCRQTSNPITKALRRMGLKGCGSAQKFIPVEYLVSSVEQRAWLLRGIMDTDGHAARNGGIDYVSASLQLCCDVENLVRGLGGIAKRGKVKVVNGVDYHRTYLKMPAEIAPFHLPRKLSAWTPPAVYPCAKMIASIEPDGVEECQCISVSSPHRTYLTRDYTVTHNTAIAECVRQLYGRKLGHARPARACYVCTTKSLQDQFVKDFPASAVVKGKSNYPTAFFGHLFNPAGLDDRGVYDWRAAKEHLSCGECTYRSEKPCDWCGCAEDSSANMSLVRCPYRKARDKGRRADLAVLNTAYFMGVANSPIPRDSGDEKGFAGRELCILDEADLLEGVIMSQVEITISKSIMVKLAIEPPELRTVADGWPEWIREKVLPKLKEHATNMRAVRGLSKIERIKKLRSVTQLALDLERVANDIESGDSPWVYDGYKGVKKGDPHPVIFKPVRVNEFGQRLLWQHAEKFLVMSATFLDPKAFATSLGLDTARVKVVHVPSSFPPQQRPIVLTKSASNTFKDQDEAWPKIARDMVRILADHPSERCLVHTVSYKFTEYLIDRARRGGLGDRLLLTYSNADEREKMLEMYKATPGAVMFAPSFDRGIDLPGDLCRVQIVAKIPYPALGDKQISTRANTKPGGDRWYAMEAIRTLVQMVGRGMRKPDDWCWTYILDAQIERLLMTWRRLFPKFFLDAVVPPGFKGFTVAEVEKNQAKWSATA